MTWLSSVLSPPGESQRGQGALVGLVTIRHNPLKKEVRIWLKFLHGIRYWQMSITSAQTAIRETISSARIDEKAMAESPVATNVRDYLQLALASSSSGNGGTGKSLGLNSITQTGPSISLYSTLHRLAREVTGRL